MTGVRLAALVSQARAAGLIAGTPRQNLLATYYLENAELLDQVEIGTIIIDRQGDHWIRRLNALGAREWKVCWLHDGGNADNVNLTRDTVSMLETWGPVKPVPDE